MTGRYTHVNELFYKIFGPFPSGITSYQFSSTLFHEDTPLYLQTQRECLSAPGNTASVDLRSIRSDGSLFWTRWEFCALTDNENIIGMQAIGNDISETKRAESEKTDAEKNLHLLMNNTEESFIMLDRDLKVLSFNRVAEEKMDFFLKRLLKKGLSIFDFADPERLNALQKLYADVLKGENRESSTRISKNGKTVIYNNHYKAAYGANGEIVGVVITSRDNTMYSYTEEKLNRERYLLRTLIDHIPDYVYVKDTNFRHIINNKAQLDFIGVRTEEESIGKTAFDFLDKETADAQITKDREILRSGETVSDIEEAIVNRRGEKKWLLTTRAPLKESDGKVIGLVGISRDITERKKIEESLRISIERFNILSKAANDAIWDWDLISGNILWNDAVKLFGYTPEQIAGDHRWREDHIHPEDRERIVSRIYSHIKNGIESWQDQYRFLCADGSFKFILDRGFILFDKDHKPYRMIGAMVDVSDRIRLQEELTSQNIARQRQITEAAIMAQEKQRAEIGRELHDNINQILTTTKLYIDMAMNEKDIREELMIKSYSNISSAIEEIRILSKSLVPPSLGDIGLKEAISEMIGNLNISQKINIKLRTSGFGKVNIPGNIKLMVFRIVQEQLNNIIKHSKATAAEIKLVVSKENLNITVTDNGIGFDSKKKGRGIGLTNITSRAEVHNGNVEIISSPGNGCYLKVSIPI